MRQKQIPFGNDKQKGKQRRGQLRRFGSKSNYGDSDPLGQNDGCLLGQDDGGVVGENDVGGVGQNDGGGGEIWLVGTRATTEILTRWVRMTAECGSE